MLAFYTQDESAIFKTIHPIDGTQMNLDDLSDFLLVATHEGFTQASRLSGRPKASLSRKVMNLEASLGVRLFERGSRTIRLTQEGSVLFERISGPMREISETANLLQDGRAHPQGLLRVNVPTLFAQMMMGRIAAEFTRSYPEVRLSITLEDRQVDLIKEGYDLVIRVNPEKSSDLVGRCFARDQILTVSTPELKNRYMRSIKKSMKPLPVIVRGSSSHETWKIDEASDKEIPVSVVLQLPLFTMMRDAVLTGIGAARLPRLVVADDISSGRVVSWGVARDAPAELWGLHTSSRLPSAKVKAFMNFLESHFRNT